MNRFSRYSLDKDPFGKKENVFGMKNVDIYWNMEDYPIPPGADLRLISHEIISALRLVGCQGCMLFRAFGPNLLEKKDSLLDAGFEPIIPEEDYEAYHIGIPESTTTDEAIWRLIICSTTYRPKVLVVISKQRPDSELPRVLQCVQARNATVVVVDPQGNPFPTTADSFLECAQLLGRSKLSSMYKHGIPEGIVECNPDGSVKYDPNSAPCKRMYVT